MGQDGHYKLWEEQTLLIWTVYFLEMVNMLLSVIPEQCIQVQQQHLDGYWDLHQQQII